MTPAARLSAAIEILDQVLGGDPATLTLTNWGRQSRFAGSKDRAAVRDIVYDCLRRKRSYAHRMGEQTGRALVVAHAAGNDPDWATLFTGEGYGPAPPTEAELRALETPSATTDAVRFNYPDFLDAEFKRSLGADFEPVMAAMQDRAPVDLRVNLGRISREGAAERLAADEIGTAPVPDLPTALRVTRNPRRVAQSTAYKTGLVELQDASSQAVALFSGAQPGMRVLDYCAGGGGKALALYDMLGGQGHVVAHDIAAVRMNDLPARAARAKARITVAQPGHPALQADQFDLVFVDAPCSGTGSWRRTPDAKWRITPRDLDNLDRVQAEILVKSSALVRPGGLLLYATCSLLARENMDRVEDFLRNTPRYALENTVQLTPVTMGDGFFAAQLRREKE